MNDNISLLVNLFSMLFLKSVTYTGKSCYDIFIGAEFFSKIHYMDINSPVYNKYVLASDTIDNIIAAEYLARIFHEQR